MYAITTTHPVDGHTALRFGTAESAHSAVDHLNACPDRHAYFRGRVTETHCSGYYTPTTGLSHEAAATGRAIVDFGKALPHRTVVDVRSMRVDQERCSFECRVVAGWVACDEMPLPEDLADAQREQEAMRA